MLRRNKSLIIGVGLLIGLSMCNVGTINANEPVDLSDSIAYEYTVATNDLNGVGVGNIQQNGSGATNNATLNAQDQQNKDSADAVSDLFQNAGINDESTAQANTFLAPLARGINIVCAFVLGLTSLGLFLVTALDLLYIGFPPVRNMLNPQSQGGGGSAYGAGGGQASSGVRWISDEALACAGGGGSTGGDMMGGPMMGGGSQQGNAKSMIMTYLKKRTVFLIVFAICVVLFTSTVFTDLGLRLGMLVLSWITGMNASIPM